MQVKKRMNKKFQKEAYGKSSDAVLGTQNQMEDNGSDAC